MNSLITDSSSESEVEDEISEQEKQELKKKKAFNVAQEIMTSEKTFIDILRLLNIVSEFTFLSYFPDI